MIGPLEQKDAIVVARLHIENLETNFAGLSGRKLLACYYRVVASGAGAVGYGWTAEAGSMAGFICGVWDSHRLWRSLVCREWPGLLFWGCVHAIAHIRLNLRVLMALGKRLGLTKNHSKTLKDLVGYELRPIAVRAAMRGQGVAQALLQKILEDARSRGFSAVFLKTETANRRANAFYLKSGFRLVAAKDGRNYFQIGLSSDRGNEKPQLLAAEFVDARQGSLTFRHVIHRLRETGLSDSARIFLLHCESFLFDWRNGTDTLKRIPLSELNIPFASKGHGTKHDASPIFVLRRILRQVGIRAGDVFVDFGSGKGRSLLLAGEFPFRRIVGVEFSEELCQIARENVRRYMVSHPGMAPLEIRHADAGQICVEADWTVLYFFNPFDAEVMQLVLRNVEESYRVHPRRIRLLYCHPVCREVFDNCSFLHLERSFNIMGRQTLLYQTVGRF